MFDENKYLDMELFSSIISKFDWPASYELENNLPDSMLLNFEKCTLFFSEQEGSEISLNFASYVKDYEYNLELTDALMVLIPNFENTRDPFSHISLINDISVTASKEKVENCLSDACVLALEFLKPYITGEYTWIRDDGILKPKKVFESNQRINFVSGHLDLTEEEFNKYYVPLIDHALNTNEGFIVGDAQGADSFAQKYLHGKTKNVTIYHMLTSPRNNAGFELNGGFDSDSSRDREMTKNSSKDICWVRQGREKSGTQRNLNRRKKIKS